MLAYLLQIDAVEPATGEAVVLRASSVDDDRVCGQDGERWWPAIAQLPALRYDLFDGGFAGRIDTPQSSLTLSTAPFPTLPGLMLADARVQLWSVVPGSPFSYLRFAGRCLTQPTVKDGLASLPIAVDDRWLDQPLLGTYAGTGGIEGDLALKGSEKPLALGAPRFVPGKLINSADNVFQLSAVGPIQGVEVAFERLGRFGPPTADYASYADLVSASITPGAWATCLAQGLVRFGAPPAGKISFHVQGDKAGHDGWARLPGRIIKRLALMAGGDGRINEASLAALDVARPWTISPYIESQITARELIQRIAASVNAVAGVTWTGQLFVTPVQVGTADVTLDATGASLPPTMPLEQLEMAPPFWRLAIEAERTWAVHGLSDVAFTAPLVPRGRFLFTETYREGHIVDLADGSEWLFIGTTPATGVPPPVGTLGDATWQRIKPPTQIADMEGAGDLNPLGDGNRIRYSPILPGRSAGYQQFAVAGATVVETPSPFALNGRTYFQRRFEFTGNGQSVAVATSYGDRIPVRPNERVSVQVLVTVGAFNNLSRLVDVKLVWLDGEGAFLSDSPIASALAQGVHAAKAFATAPAGAFTAVLEVGCYNTTAGAGLLDIAITDPMFSGAGSLQTKHPSFTPGPSNEPGADVTSTVTGPSSVILNYEAGGVTPQAGQLPNTISLRLIRSGVDVTEGATWAITSAPSGWSGSISNAAGSKGQLTTNSMTPNTAEVKVAATYQGGDPRPHMVTFEKKSAAPTASSGGGSGGGTTAVDDSFAAVTSASAAAPTVVSDELSVIVGAAGVVSLRLNVDHSLRPIGYGERTQTLGIKTQWWNGSAWIDNFGYQLSNPYAYNFNEQPQSSTPTLEQESLGADNVNWPGNVTKEHAQNALSPGSSQKYRMVAYIAAGVTDAAYLSGSLIVSGIN